MTKIAMFFKNEDGASMAEYAVLLAIVTAGAVAALTTLGGSINTVVEKVAGVITVK